MLNETQVKAVAKALGIPEEQNEFVWEYCFKHPKEIIQKIKEFIGE